MAEEAEHDMESEHCWCNPQLLCPLCSVFGPCTCPTRDDYPLIVVHSASKES